jgi:hypothetical protein
MLRLKSYSKIRGKRLILYLWSFTYPDFLL